MAGVAGWEALAWRLLAARLAAGGESRLTITTGSMAPFLLPGDRVLLAAAPPQLLRVGDLVALGAQPHPIVHRVVVSRGRGAARRLVTKGDGAAACDPRLTPPLSPPAVLGRVVAVERQAQVLALTTPVAHGGAWLLAQISRLGPRTARLPSPSLRRAVLFALHLALYTVAAAVWHMGREPVRQAAAEETP